MPDFEPVLTRNVHKPQSHTLAVYQSDGGYEALRRTLRDHTPEQIVEIVKASGLRGRGGAGFPCGAKWAFLPPKRTETYMCVNADESEPGTFNNRILMERDPHQVLEGIAIACYATRARVAYIYLRYEYPQGYAAARAAIGEAYAGNPLGPKTPGPACALDVRLQRAPAAQLPARDRRLIESLEGK